MMATSTEAAATLTNISGDEDSSQLYTLYFIRHAEALHNQLEKEAQSTALALAVSQGHDPNSPYAKKVQEDARKAILESDTIEDPPLSALGFDEARKAKRTLEKLIAAHNLPHVEEVWVSPLERAMQTAATIFPESSSPRDSAMKISDSAKNESSPTTRPPIMRVKKEIEERQTGFACDIHSPYEEKRKRKTFKRFSLSALKMDKLAVGGKMDKLAVGGKMGNCAPSFTAPAYNIEEKPMLRERTKKLFNLLAETECRSICVVAHKGYLRELERGPLGKAESDMFQNCEVRVYRLQLDSMGDTAGLVDGSVEGMVDFEGDLGVKSHGNPIPVIQHAEKIAESRIDG